MKLLRQGQTVYYIDIRPHFGVNATPKLVRYFLHSHKTPLPPPGVILEKLPVTLAREVQGRGFKFYESRRKAERVLKQMGGANHGSI